MRHDIGEIKSRLAARIESLVARFYPNAVKSGNFAYLGSTRGEKGSSLTVWLKGRKQGEWFDHSRGEGGDALDLIAAAQGCDFKSALQWAADWTGARPIDDETPAQRRAREERAKAEAETRAREEADERARRTAAAKALWLSGAAVAGTPGDAYLRGRAIDLTRLDREVSCLRYHGDVRAADGSRRPALLAAVSGEGGFATVHRHFLAHVGGVGWVKADDERVPERERMAKRSAKQAYGPYGGGMIAVWRGDGHVGWRSATRIQPAVIATEGLEDALSWVIAMPDMRVCAAIGLGNLGKMWLPTQVDTLFWHRHRGDGPPAVALYQRQVEELARREIAVNELLAPGEFKDVNEWLQAEAAKG